MEQLAAKDAKDFLKDQYESSSDILVEGARLVKLQSITATDASIVGSKSAFKWECALTVSLYLSISILKTVNLYAMCVLPSCTPSNSVNSSVVRAHVSLVTL